MTRRLRTTCLTDVSSWLGGSADLGEDASERRTALWRPAFDLRPRVAVAGGEPLLDERGELPVELLVDEPFEFVAVPADVLGDELPHTIDDLRVCPS